MAEVLLRKTFYYTRCYRVTSLGNIQLNNLSVTDRQTSLPSAFDYLLYLNIAGT